MRAAWSIAVREFASYFRTPTGWVVLALWLLLSGYAFSASVLTAGAPASMREVFVVGQWLLLIVAPAVTMRVFSEELRSGTLETLMATPASEWQTVAGKFLGAGGFLLAALLCTLTHVAVLEWVADPEYGPIVTGYLGLVLVGLVYVSAGMVFSAVTTSQPVAFLLTLFFFIGWQVLTTRVAAALPAPWDGAVANLSVAARVGDFAKGVIDTGHVVFFLAASAVFLVVSVVILESRRWR